MIIKTLAGLMIIFGMSLLLIPAVGIFYGLLKKILFV